MVWVDGSAQPALIKKPNILTAAAAAYRDFSSKEWKDSITVKITPRGIRMRPSLEAEFLAIQEAFRIACELSDNFDTLLIFSDCQSILQCLRTRKPFRSLRMKDIANNTFMYANELYNLGIIVELRWVPGHALIEGNERVDKLAEPFLAQISRG